VTQIFIDKAQTYALAVACGVPSPRTLVPHSLEEAESQAESLGFPLLLKPAEGHLYYARFKRKMVKADDMAAMRTAYTQAAGAGLGVMIQEIIPGADSDVVNYNAYAWGGRSLVEFTARQLRKAPPRFGSPRAVVSERIDGLAEVGRAALRALAFEGFACVEFKRDPRDGRYKLLDVNGRHNLSGLLAVRCGVNFPLLQYRHVSAGELPERTQFRTGVYWVDVVRDVAYGLRHVLEERPSPRAILAPYLGPGCDAIFDRRDLRPFLVRCAWLARAAVGRG